MKLAISETLVLPPEVVTKKLAWLGTTGGGKTYAAQKMAELLWEIGAQFVVLDPAGVWYGLRLARDGYRPSGITVPIFGGLETHRDLPLEHTAGAFMADLIVDKGISAILDVSQFESDAQKARFAADFADRFFFRKKAAPSAVHLFLEECHEFIPQNTQRGEERMLHAFTRMQKLGRNFGIGSSLISQRPQEVNKKALNLAQTLFVFRSTGPQERKAIDGWISSNGLDHDLARDLPKLPTGTCHVWSPEFLKISETVKINAKTTFDASAEPAVGATAVARQLAHIDLDRIRADMAATIERAKADDPAELRKRITELERAAKKSPPPCDHLVEISEIRAQLTRVVRENEFFRKVAANVSDRIREELDGLMNNVPSELTQRIASKAVQAPPVSARALPARSRAAGNGSKGNGSVALGKGERAILTVLAMYPDGKNRRALGTLAGYTASGGSFGTYISRLRTAGYITGNEPIRITPEGLDALGEFEPLPRGEELQRYWLERLGKGEATILRVLLEQYPREVTREELGRLSGYEASGGSFGTYLSRLRTKEVIHERELRASEAFFE